MLPQLKHSSHADFATLSVRDMDALRAQAHALQAAHSVSDAGSRQLLRGKNLGLLCDRSVDAGAALFQRAATALGAHVAQLRPSLSASSSPQEVQHTARVLGRLYDAVDCVGMAPDLVRRIGVEAGVPVFDGIASLEHPTARLAEWLAGGRATDESRCFVIQAVLLRALA